MLVYPDEAAADAALDALQDVAAAWQAFMADDPRCPAQPEASTFTVVDRAVVVVGLAALMFPV